MSYEDEEQDLDSEFEDLPDVRFDETPESVKEFLLDGEF